MAADDTLSGVSVGVDPLGGPFQMSEKLAAAQAVAGTSRHYKGPGLGAPPPWDCPRCGRTWQGDPSNGCPVCIAEAIETLKKHANEELVETHREEPTERTGRMVQEPHTAAPTPQMITAAVSPLVAQRGLTQDRLADAVAEAVVEKIKDYLQSPDAATARQVVGDILAADAPALYAYFIGLQLVVQALHDGAGDPLLPPTAAVEAQLRQLEASPTLQSYLLTAPGAVPSEEPQA